MSDELQQGNEVGKSIIDNWPLLAIVFTPIAELGRRVFKSATKKELDEACATTERRFEKIHTELREDIKGVSDQVSSLTQHLLRRREDRE